MSVASWLAALAAPQIPASSLQPQAQPQVQPQVQPQSPLPQATIPAAASTSLRKAPPPRRRLLLWQGERPDGRLRFMYDPIMQTLRRGANETLNLDLWTVEQRFGGVDSAEAAAELDALKCGDIFVWIGKAQLGAFVPGNGKSVPPRSDPVYNELVTYRIQQRGVRTIYYQSEPFGPAEEEGLMFSPSFCDFETSPFDEIWDYSHANLKRYWDKCPAGVTRPVVRYVPPGNLNEMALQREDVIDNCVAGSAAFLGGPRPERLQYISIFESQAKQSPWQNLTARDAFAVSMGDGIWDYDTLDTYLRQSCVQLNIHKYAKLNTEAFEAVRAATLVSAGALLVSQISDLDDQREWAGIVHFAETPQAHGVEAARLTQLPAEERRHHARARAKLFDEKFSPKRIFENANMGNILHDAMPEQCTEQR